MVYIPKAGISFLYDCLCSCLLLSVCHQTRDNNCRKTIHTVCLPSCMASRFRFLPATPHPNLKVSHRGENIYISGKGVELTRESVSPTCLFCRLSSTSVIIKPCQPTQLICYVQGGINRKQITFMY